jgi:hypothetical protein
MANVEKGVILIPRFTRNYQKKKRKGYRKRSIREEESSERIKRE